MDADTAQLHLVLWSIPKIVAAARLAAPAQWLGTQRAEKRFRNNTYLTDVAGG